jgi:hypothetical protein
MTKSGVGTTTTTTNSNNNHTSMNGQTSTSTTTATEIPIWVSDRKKWVTGISKKTTINDIIYAILKQCHINCEYEYINDYVLVEIMYSLTNEHYLTDHHHHQQQQNFIINAERVLKGTSKVYKYLSKWIENSNKLILKVKKCEISDDANNSNNGLNVSLSSASSTATTIDNNSLDTTLTGVSNTNTITKFFKKLTNVNNNNNNNNASSNNSSSNINNSNKTFQSNNMAKQIVKYIDVKLPAQHHNTNVTPMLINTVVNQQSTLPRVNKAGIVPIASLHQQQQQQQHQYKQLPNEYELDYDQPIQQQQKLNDYNPLPYKQYDPTLQKTLIISNILDKDKKLNQQFERVKLLDELIKEAEKTLVINENYYISNQQFIEDQTQQLPTVKQAAAIYASTKPPPVQSDLNLNDIYSCFPEMNTHGSNEVEEFQQMCTKLLNLDDNVHQQKQLLNKLEMDIQKELTMNNSQINQIASNIATNNENLDDLLQVSSTLVETPETVKLKKEVTSSREQTRVQCKELHDLDLRMRQNESMLVHKENELKSLLEELYLHEIYMDSNAANDNIDNKNQTSLSYIQKTATLTHSSAATNSKLKTLAGGVGNMLSSSSTSTASSSSSSSASLTPPIEHLVNKSSISLINTIASQQVSPATQPPPLPTSLPPSTNTTTQSNGHKSNDHCDNDSGISSMSSENDANLMHHNSSKMSYLQLKQQPVKSVMETLV